MSYRYESPPQLPPLWAWLVIGIIMFFAGYIGTQYHKQVIKDAIRESQQGKP